MAEDKLLITSGAKGVQVAWLKTFLDGAKHLLGVYLFDGAGDNINSYKGYLGDDIYASQVVRGNIDGASPLIAYGESVAGGAVTNQPLFPLSVGSSVNVPPPSGVQMFLVSDDAEDDKDGGDGARSIHLHYLDGDLNEQIEEVFLEGLTPVTTNATDIRFVQCSHIHTYGPVTTATGNINTYTAGPVNYSHIDVGAKRCSSSFRRVPAGKRLMIKSMHAGCVSGTAGSKGIIRLVATKVDDVDYTEDGFFIPVFSLAFQDNSVPLTLDMPIAVDPGVVIGMEYDVDKAATVTGGYVGYLENV